MTSSADTTRQPIRSEPVSASAPAGGPARPRGRWEVWRSPAGQPGWARPGLLVTAGLAALLYAWNITSSGLAPYYAASARSMSVSWRALLFGAFDPGATITPDKIAGSFVPQALCARVFGFHAWALTLPQCVEGVVCVLVTYRMVRRWAGPAAGLAAAAVFACTPICASMFGHAMEDGALTMCLVLAADRFQVAVTGGRLRSLVWAGVWVGVGFQAKMMQAWLVLPGFAVCYLLCAPGALARRARHVLTAGAACLAVSLSWVALMTAVPAHARPYADGSTDNSAFAMVFGYNGLSRFGVDLPGALPDFLAGAGGKSAAGSGGPHASGAHGSAASGTGSGAASGAASQAPASRGATAHGAPAGGAGAPPAASGKGGGRQRHHGPARDQGDTGWTKLFGLRFGPQILWTLPFALIGTALGLYGRRRAGRTDTLRTGFVAWGSWLLVVGLVFSKMSGIPHAAYLATLAPPLAALTGAGAVLMWRAYRDGRRDAWALPAAVAAQAGWACWLWSYHADFLPWLRWLALGAGAAGAAVLALGRLAARTRARLTAVGLLAGVAGAFAAPAAWSASVLDTRYGGWAIEASAGPSADLFGLRATASLTDAQRRLWAYVERHRGGAEYPLTTTNWMAAEPFILATGQKVLPMGGFSGAVPDPTLKEFTRLVGEGRVRLVLTRPGGGGIVPGVGTTGRIAAWVAAHCARVPAADYGGQDPAAGGSAPRGGPGRGGPDGGVGGALYRCAAGDARE
ncbi:glycosyltransferase family 39 protein [Streptomyces sp. B1866]|uniref:ArnT family glycosyltransferase n=1 Tax=Streptomyces sp. B1866 TaxID=3075431 RepID=UPI0028927135|nr:glycosyltransferase family 39 protein [Streptomyces sp. B1866]MDT3400624.1 glycosyltransferase family 39 protein [Streptomyces sp. B1866]